MFPAAPPKAKPKKATDKKGMDAKAKKVPFQVTDIVCTPKDAPRFMNSYTSWLNSFPGSKPRHSDL
jgi:hypothetical protein